MAEYVATWRVVVQADNATEARSRHRDALAATDVGHVTVYVWGDGPVLTNATMSAGAPSVIYQNSGPETLSVVVDDGEAT